ncbi:MAG TPA: beta-eliminating lyase-related protein [Thermoanaerobaculia bacterium]|nr:beta-eliminating lyase-related protein [Thermoanaerobaculia bacterium]
MNRDFRSDNTHGASPEILEALTRAAAGTMTSYGGDEITARVRERCCEIFEHDVDIFPVVTGTAGNALSIAALTPPSGSVLCHEDAHIYRDELGAPEFFTGGAELVPIPGDGGKLNADDVRKRAHEVTCVSITQATEAGTVYTADEVRAIASVGLPVHMDGARFANALVTLESSAADITWRAGVDVLVFGGTKNGVIPTELIVVFRKELAEEIAPRWHRSGHRVSKMRFLSAQFEAYLADDLWLRNARRANAVAQRIGRELEVIHPVQANVVFVRFEPRVVAALIEEGFLFFDWPLFGPDAFRLVCGFGTTDEDADALVAAVKRCSGSTPSEVEGPG